MNIFLLGTLIAKKELFKKIEKLKENNYVKRITSKN